MVRRAVAFAAACALVACGTASAYLVAAPGGRPSATGTIPTTTLPALPASVGAGALLFTGHGWGHGVGMSQWGAYGYAKRGWTFELILDHFYPGTTLGPAPVRTLRVALAEAAKTVAVASPEPWKLRDASGQVRQLGPGKVVLGPNLKTRLPASAAPTQLAQPVTFLPGRAPLQVAGKPYRGSLEVSVQKAKLQAVNVVSLEGYLKGVVPSEMPSGWLPEALKAQAVAARSYALAHRAAGAAFDLYSDVRSQLYLGMSAETESASAAVDATRGRVLLYDGKVADTLFFSSSGGKTAPASEVFKGPKFPPYLVSVPDPYDTASPYHDWGPVAIDVSKAAARLKLKNRVADLRPELWPSGRVRRATAVGPLGSVVVSGADLRRLLGLRSTWFQVGLLTLERPYGPVTYGNAVTIAGLARNTGDPVALEQRIGTPFWSPSTPVQPDASGAFSIAIKPTATLELRLTAGTTKAPALRVPVAPLVRLGAPTDRTTLRGTTKPVVPGGSVQIQRLDGTLWTDVAQAVVDDQGAFAATLDLVAGTYRARYAPGGGLVAGLSAQLQVVS